MSLISFPGAAPEGGLSLFGSRIESERVAASLRALVDAASGELEPGGLLAFYGVPEWVLTALTQAPPAFELQHWIAAVCQPDGGEWPVRSHKAIAVLALASSSPAMVPLRAPHRLCAACGEPLRDWGGRRKRMHTDGTRLSDVWSDLALTLGDPAPAALVDRLRALAGAEAGATRVHVAPDSLRLPQLPDEPPSRTFDLHPVLSPLLHKAVQSDSLELLRCLPSGSVDLAFADPPYNLEKAYLSSADRRARGDYIAWCNAWLTEYARVVRPGGTIAILTLPGWAAAHVRFLLRHRAMRFDRWIVWDALAEPKGGGLLPAHYALILFTKGAPRRPPQPLPVVASADDLCRRASCIAARAPALRAPVTDVWRDIPRLRHRRHREGDHPCQLPGKLMERIVALASPPGGIVLDAFCGTGTTGVAALRLARRPVLADISAEYVQIASQRLARH
jgi:site-specific DNA-methyltransferase (adenine-specific)